MNKASKIVDIKYVNENNIKFILQNEDIAAKALPGQFVNIKCTKGDDLLLRRPISIYDAYDDLYEVIVKIVGKGTKALTDFSVHDEMDVLGPLGKGFTNHNNQKVAFIGGGIGLFPLYFAAKKFKDCDKDFYIGFRNQHELMIIEEIAALNCQTYIATDDGSFGYKGYVTDLYKSIEKQYDMVYICGPQAMEISTVKYLRGIGQKGQVSLEERMACGIGACLGCACQTIHGVKHVCSDGPVFDIYEVFNGENI